MTKNVAWSADMVRYLDELLERGIYEGRAIREAFRDKFGVMPCHATVCRRLREKGIQRWRDMSGWRVKFLDFAEQNPGVGAYALCRMFNEQYHADVYGQLARFWIKRAAA